MARLAGGGEDDFGHLADLGPKLVYSRDASIDFKYRVNRSADGNLGRMTGIDDMV